MFAVLVVLSFPVIVFFLISSFTPEPQIQLQLNVPQIIISLFTGLYSIFNLSYCLYACNNFLHVNSMSLINKHTKEDFFYVPSTVTNTTHPRHKLAQASKFHLLVTFLNFLKLIYVLIPLPPCWLHLKHFYACLPYNKTNVV